MGSSQLLASTYEPDLAPIADSLLWSSLIATLPVLTIFLTLGLLRWKAHWAGLAALAVAAVVAVVGYGMPVGLALLAATEGAAFGLFPIIWIVLTAIWLYQLTVVSGRFEDLHATFDAIDADPRVQAIIIAFCFGGLLEALAGFGTPVAITAVMLMAVGLSRLRAAVVALLANTAPVAFGAMAIPIITAGNLTGIPYEEIGAYVGRQTSLVAVVVPLLLVLIVDGWRGVRETWPVAVTVGVVFGLAQFVSSNFVSVALTDIIASLAGLAAAVLLLRVWKPSGGHAALGRLAADEEHDEATHSGAAGGDAGAVAVEERTETQTETQTEPLTARRVWLALFPYLLVILIFSLAKLVDPIERALVASNLSFPWPGLGDVAGSSDYTFEWLSSPGTLLLICGIVVAAVYRVPAATAAGELVRTVVKLRWAILTVASVLALAYVMNLAGLTVTIGTWIAGAGAALAFLSPVLGWLGTAVTGSDTSSNALFATLQQSAAQKAGLDPTLLVAANTAGGVVGKMISPQNLAIAASAVGLVGRESDIFRRVILWSLGLLVVLCLLVGLQSTPVLSWMLP